MDPFLLVKKGDLEGLKQFLLINSCDIENENKETLLHYSIKSNNIDVLIYLLRSNISVNKQDIFGNTALMLGVQYNKLGFIKVLIKHKADINIPNLRNETPLFKACLLGREDIVSLLLSHKANLDVLNINNENLCFPLVRSGNIKLLNQVVKKKINLNETLNYYDDTLLHVSVKSNNFLMSKYLIEHNACVHLKNKDFETPLFIAIRNENLEIVELLLNNNAQYDIFNILNEDIFKIKTSKPFKKYLSDLIEMTSDKYHFYSKCYPLHQAIISQDLHLTKALLNKNLLKVKDSFGYLPIDYARVLNNKEILFYIEAFR